MIYNGARLSSGIFTTQYLDHQRVLNVSSTLAEMFRASIREGSKGFLRHGVYNVKSTKPSATMDSKENAALVDRILASGSTPLDVIIEEMRFHSDVARTERKRGANANHAKIVTSLKAASAAAQIALPYVHPRTATANRVPDRSPHHTTDVRKKIAALFGVDEALLRDGPPPPHVTG